MWITLGCCFVIFCKSFYISNVPWTAINKDLQSVCDLLGNFPRFTSIKEDWLHIGIEDLEFSPFQELPISPCSLMIVALKILTYLYSALWVDEFQYMLQLPHSGFPRNCWVMIFTHLSSFMNVITPNFLMKIKLERLKYGVLLNVVTKWFEV
jgi:hypothetical protein